MANAKEFEHYIADLPEKSDIIDVQETWLKIGNEVLLKEYECHRHDREGQRGGAVATWIRCNVPTRRLTVSINSSIECIVTEVSLTDMRISICNIYPAEPESETRFFNDILLQLPSVAFFCGDFNAHNPLWGCKKTNSKESHWENL